MNIKQREIQTNGLKGVKSLFSLQTHEIEVETNFQTTTNVPTTSLEKQHDKSKCIHFTFSHDF